MDVRRVLITAFVVLSLLALADMAFFSSEFDDEAGDTYFKRGDINIEFRIEGLEKEWQEESP